MLLMTRECVGAVVSVERSLSNKTGSLPERLCFWTSACRVLLQWPQMRLDICLAFHSVKVITDRESHTHAIQTGCNTVVVGFLCHACESLKMLRADLWFLTVARTAAAQLERHVIIALCLCVGWKTQALIQALGDPLPFLSLLF